METFNDASLTPDQIKMLTLQFMGQHLTGELKELDKNLVNKTNTLQGMALDPTAVLNSIPSQHIAQPPQPQPVLSSQPITLSTTVEPSLLPATTETPSLIDQNQLEFSFETSPLSERIFSILERLEQKLSLIEEKIQKLENIKKKG
jgi:hypothetical protein